VLLLLAAAVELSLIVAAVTVCSSGAGSLPLLVTSGDG
jgi:hypothetical protein